jgi:hypothetical protein
MATVQLVYVSERLNRESACTAQAELESLRKTSTERNLANNITGHLIHDDRWFVQALEGDALCIRDLFGRIVRDRRHRNVDLMVLRPIRSRTFPRWSMQADAVRPSSHTLIELNCSKDGFEPKAIPPASIISLLIDLSDR